MKKLFTLLSFFLTMTATGQTADTFLFVNAGGEPIADGAQLTVTTAETDDFGFPLLPSGLSVKNTSGVEAGIRINYNVQTLENGSFQICFPLACITETAVVSKSTPADVMTAQEVRSLQTEWLPVANGQCKVTYQVEVMKKVNDFGKFESTGVFGPSVTVVYNYNGSSGIDAIRANGRPVRYYDLSGNRLPAPRKGLNIVVTEGQKVLKQIVK